jgi:hypothetical protein
MVLSGHAQTRQHVIESQDVQIKSLNFMTIALEVASQKWDCWVWE